MPPRTRSRALVGVLLAALAAQTLAQATTTSATATVEPTFSYSPHDFIGGQLVTYEGDVGAGGVVVKLQGSQRPGAKWSTIARTRSQPDGTYRFSRHAPSMRGIQRRVVARGAASDPIRMYADSQDLVLVPVGTPVAGESFELRVSTVPGPHWGRGHDYYVKGRPDLPAPVFPGRVLTLQQRGADGYWTDVPGGTTTSNNAGEGSFNVTARGPGTVVYRAVQEDYSATVTDRAGTVLGRHDIGWFPSFPVSVHVAASRAEATTYARSSVQPTGGTTTVTSDDGTEGESLAARKVRHGFNASTAQAANGWGGALWDFGLPRGEALTSPPSRGTRPRGWWLDGSDGSGRANQHNGGVSLNSQRYAPDKGENENAGDHGSTWITLRDNARKFGRWEARIRLRPYEKAARDYRAKIELIPEREDQRCAGRTITVADLAAHSRKMRFGVKSVRAKRRWAKVRRVGDVNNYPVAVAVEVTKRHITWFFNGRPVGTVRKKSSVPRVPLTMSITLQGKGNREMNRTMAHMDWMRGFSLRRGEKTRNGGKMRVRRFRGGC
jgi:hypothetical protein